jgi:chemotaxis protein MotB
VNINDPEKMGIRIEGRSDSDPIHKEGYDPNRKRSTACATEIIKLLIPKIALASCRLSASGYAEHYPTASNDTAEGRTMSRRVDWVILHSFSDAGAPAPIVVTPEAIPSVSAPE